VRACAILAVAVTATLVMAAPSRAEKSKLDGSRNLLCAASRVIECTTYGECKDVPPVAAELPDFFVLDFKKKQISAVQPPDDDTSPIEFTENNHGSTIVTGSDGGEGWGIRVDQHTGKMSGAVYSNGMGFMIFGACTPQ